MRRSKWYPGNNRSCALRVLSRCQLRSYHLPDQAGLGYLELIDGAEWNDVFESATNGLFIP